MLVAADGKNNINLALLQRSHSFSIENKNSSSRKCVPLKPNAISINRIGDKAFDFRIPMEEVPLFSAISKNRFLSFYDLVLCQCECEI